MPDIPFFSNADSKRISDVTVWGEGIQDRGVQLTDNEQEEFPEQIFVQLGTEEDAWYTGMEVHYKDDTWRQLENPKVFAVGEGNYGRLRHYAWEVLPIGSVVSVSNLVNVKTGVEEWVFYNEVSNPEAFIFKNTATMNSVSGPFSPWVAERGGSVLTNVGTLDVAGNLMMAAASYAGIEIVFIDDGNGFRLSTAAFTTVKTDYWVEGGGGGGQSASSPPGTITINWPLATTIVTGSRSRLTQHYAGDIHIEIFGFSSDDDDDDDPYPKPKNITVVGDNKWIKVTRAGNIFTVTHILPPNAAPCPENDFKALNKNFSCDDVVFSDLQDAEDWANSLLDNIKKVFYDQKGHTYKMTDCDGGNVEEYDEEDDDLLTATLTGNIVGSALLPNVVLNSSGLDFIYKLLNRGRLFTNWIGQENIMFSIKNDLGETVKFQLGNIAAGIGAIVGFDVSLAANVEGTSGKEWNAVNGAADDAVLLSPIRYRFNSSVTIRTNVVNIGYGKSLSFATKVDEAVILFNGVLAPPVIRDHNDPLSVGIVISVGYATSPDDLALAYKVRYKFTYADGVDVRFSDTGSGAGPFTTGWKDMALTIYSTFEPNAAIFFALDAGRDPGEVIKLCTELVTDPSIAGNDGLTYNANVDECIDLSISSDSDCVVDESGEQVTDDSGECITSGSQTITIDGTSDTGVSLFLTAGNYTISYDDNAVNEVNTMPASWRTVVTIQQTAETFFGDGGGFTTEAAAIANMSGATDTFIVASDTTYKFYFNDSAYTDNSGQIICTITSS